MATHPKSRHTALKRGSVLGAAAVAAFSFVGIAPAYAESISVSFGPGTSTVQDGTSHTWTGGAAGGSKPYSGTVNWGDGSSSKAASSSGGWSFNHVYHASCQGHQSVYTGEFSVTGATGGSGTSYFKVTVNRTGPICS